VTTGVWQVAVSPAPSGFTGAPTASVTVVANQEAAVPPLVLTRVVAPIPTEATVVMSGTAFLPAIATIARGGKVTWRNNDFITHNATGTGGIDSGNLNNAGTYERTFATSGTFNYSCTLHPGMNGQIVVQQ
jgi:plastocyanin